MPSKPSKEKSNIVTFYSYKGGVGRSMALANTAWLLASEYGKSVLVVDWDLEAPGLHRFFDIKSEDINAGLIDLLYDYKDLVREEIKSPPKQLVDINKYIKSIKTDGGTISILAAGRQDSDYATKVNQFSWDEFYSKWQGFAFIEYLRERFKESAEFVLLDSRTGITDIGGICTLQLPDIVVLLFALNNQNIDGIESIIQGIEKRATEVTDRKTPPKLIILPSRVERYLEQGIKVSMERKAAEKIGKYIEKTERLEDGALKFIKQKSIPYIGAYSFGETPLAVDFDRYGDLAESFNNLTTSILKKAGVEYSRAEIKNPKVAGSSTLFIVSGYLFIWLVTSIFFVIGIWFDFLPGFLSGLSTKFRLLLVALFSGGIGYCLQALLTLYYGISAKTINKEYLSRLPIQIGFSMVLGVLVNFITVSTELIESVTTNLIFVVTIVFSILVGVFSTTIVRRFFNTSSILFAETEDESEKRE